MGLPNQTGNLLSVGSSSGQRYFTLSSLGLASSTEFRTPSSTIDTLTLASASSTGNITIGGSFQANAGQSTMSNVSSTNLDVATRFNFVAASSTGNLTIGGTFQANAGQTTLASVSSTNLFGSGYLNFVSGRADLQAVSSTNLSASGYGLFSTLLAQNAVGLGSLSTSTSLVFIQGTQVASTTLNIRGVTNQTANLLIVASSTGTNYFTIDQIGNVSSTQNLTIGGTFQSNAGQSTFGSVSSTNAYHNGYLTVTGVTTLGNDIAFSGNNVIRRNTSDGSDSGSLSLDGGGAGFDATRGASFRPAGNEFSGAGGYATVLIGNVANSQFEVRRGDGTQAISILGSDGSATFTSSAAAAWKFNTTVSGGGYLTIQGSGVDRALLGQSLNGGGTVDFGLTAVTGNLTLRANNNANQTVILANAYFAPTVNNVLTLGVAGGRWSEVFAVNGTINTSDERLKDVVGEVPGLDFINAMKPFSGRWKDKPEQLHYWLGARATGALVPLDSAMVLRDDEHGWGMNGGELTAPIIKAIQELNLNLNATAGTATTSTPESESFVTSFFNNVYAKITTWLADAGNGITKLFAGEVHTEKLCVKKSDGSDVCVTGDELAAILADTGTSGSSSDTSSSTPEVTSDNTASSTSSNASTTPGQ